MTQTQTAEPIEHMSEEDIFAEEAERRRTGEPPADAPPVEEPPADAPPAEEPPADAPPAEEPPADTPPPAAAPPSPPVAEEKPEWYATLSDEAKASYDASQSELADMRQKFTALHGRLAPVQQANERLRQQLEQGGRPPPAQTPNSSATSSQQPGSSPAVPATPILDLGSIPEFAEFKEAFPEEAKAIAALFGKQAANVDNLQQQLGSVSQGLQQIQQASFGQQREAELNRLVTAHPDWMQVRPSEDFAQWLQGQPPSVATLADSPKADDCVWILDQFKRDRMLERQLDVTPPAAPTPPAANTVRTRRQQIRSVPGIDPQGGDVGNPVGSPLDMLSDEEIWDAEVKRRLKQQRDARR